ncbi:MAG: tripartite tricarboxylate transporter substrate binding protein [Polaromonas sp.]|uniref:Bug family tripartite tricarboxylate transporter substrate binding protein n=1 Tax=Polaromonas sp. TaxID=1869339 RepID=UPI002487CD06|nr:tripartite tricarboxylate transporter substrate binding protein [Polaromonas sp.]MDI1239999.1 tripartite tricarboxylate transporter substrate binding protein [Polaromonas sp.]
MMHRRTAIAATLLTGLAGAVMAQSSYPSRPIKIIYTFAPGGTGDIIARTLANSLTEILGQSVVVENRTGASGAIGIQAVARSPGDGYTLLVTTATTVVQAPMVLKESGFDPINTLVPLANLAMTPLVLIANEKVPANDFPSFAAWAKKQPDGVNVAVAGPTLEVATALLARDAKLKFTNVNYRGQAPALQAVLAGEVNVFFCPPSTAMTEFIKQGKLKVIGVTSADPSPAVPGGVPISRFVPNYVQDINFAAWSSPGTPPEVANRLRAAIKKGMSQPGMAEKFLAFSVPLALGEAADVTRILKREDGNIRKIMETVPIRFGG